jgi:hypothetical protein
MSIAQRIEEITEELATLQLAQDQLLEELRDLGQQATASSTSEALFQEGTRITIINPTASFGRALLPGDRTATVVKVTAKKVYFNTDSGQLNKNRIKKNVARLVE